MELYDILREYNVKSDAIDCMLNRVQLRWDREEGLEGVLSASKKFCMIPPEIILGLVHIVSADTSMDLLGHHVDRKKNVWYLHNENSEWTTQTFYVNRFNRNEDTIYHFDEIEGNWHETYCSLKFKVDKCILTWFKYRLICPTIGISPSAGNTLLTLSRTMIPNNFDCLKFFSTCNLCFNSESSLEG